MRFIKHNAVYLLLIILSGSFVCADDVEVSNNYFFSNNFDSYGSSYEHYIKDPSEAIYESTQEQYIYDNYGSSASMEYLNRGDAGSYSGGGDFDRNY